MISTSPGTFQEPVPAGVTTALVTVAGGNGGIAGAPDHLLAHGGLVTATIPVVACTTLTINVGGTGGNGSTGTAGTGGSNGGASGGLSDPTGAGGGGGGGASEVIDANGNRLVVAGGGGGENGTGNAGGGNGTSATGFTVAAGNGVNGTGGSSTPGGSGGDGGTGTGGGSAGSPNGTASTGKAGGTGGATGTAGSAGGGGGGAGCPSVAAAVAVTPAGRRWGFGLRGERRGRTDVRALGCRRWRGVDHVQRRLRFLPRTRGRRTALYRLTRSSTAPGRGSGARLGGETSKAMSQKTRVLRKPESVRHFRQAKRVASVRSVVALRFRWRGPMARCSAARRSR